MQLRKTVSGRLGLGLKWEGDRSHAVSHKGSFERAEKFAQKSLLRPVMIRSSANERKEFIRRTIAGESGQGRARTGDTGLFRAVLYQLSYLTSWFIRICEDRRV